MTRSTPAPAGLRALFTGGTATGSTDGQLLERFRSRAGTSDPVAEAAFAALVDRHAAMVWGVCRRGLLDRADAEDAFQATFLVLVRKAGSVRVDDRGSAGRWLYGVARKVAGRQRQAAARRPTVAVETASGDDPAIAAERREACAAVSAELDRLPLKYRRPIELCDYEGLTYEQAAHSLGWPTATIKSRLARGRQRLRGRLARRGLAPLAGVVAADLARECRAGVSTALLSSTPRVATAASGLVPAAVARLAEGTMRTMIGNKLKLAGLGFGLAASTVAASWASQEGTAPPPAAVAVATTAPSADRWKRTLPDGTTLEILGVTSVPSGPDTWWRPDGAPINDIQIELGTNRQVASLELAVRRVVACRISDRPKETEVVAEIAEAGASVVGTTTRMQADAPDVELRSLFIQCPNIPASLTIRFRVASGEWRTIQTFQKGFAGIGGGPGPTFVSSGAIAAEGGKTRLSLAHNVVSGDTLRIVAVDANGEERTSSSSRGASAGDVRQLTVGFDLAPDQIREFRLQSRPVEEIVMPPIAASPAGPPDAR